MSALSNCACPDQELAQAALNALEATAGIHGRLISPPINEERGRYKPDVAIELDVGDESFLFYGKCKTTVDRQALLTQIKAQLEGLNAPGLLLAPYLTAAIAEHCRSIGLQFIDTAGNAYLDAPGLFVLIKGQKDPIVHINSTHMRRGGSASALRMMFVLLVHPELTQAPYREIAKAAGIALGTVGPVFRDLAQRGLATGSDKNFGRKLLEPVRLLDEWVTNYPIRLRPKLHGRRFKAPEPNWWRNIDPIELDAWWGGEIAADHITGMLQPSTQTLYVVPEKVARCIQTLVARYRLQPDAKGELELLDAFWNLPRSETHPQLAPPILVYADLMASLDARNLEIAGAMRSMVTADV